MFGSLAKGVVVVGDVMLDAYLAGVVDRISPEAPVPVLRHTDEREITGGAANVAANLVALGASVTLIGVTGDDADGGRIRRLLTDAGISCELVVDQSRRTSRKTRIVAGRQQLLRIDQETGGAISGDVETDVIRRALAYLATSSCVIMSDYAKGCLTDRVLGEIIAASRRAGVPVFVDPKRKNFSAYQGANYIKPNIAELTAATGFDCRTDVGARAGAASIIAATGAEVLLTRSERGMTLFRADGESFDVPTAARDVFDVSGAGDTVMAAFALSIVSGEPISRAMRIANVAAGIVVSKFGVATVSAEELANAVLDMGAEVSEAAPRKLMDIDQALSQRALWNRQGLRVAFTNGCFDILHPGHVSLLQQARGQADRLIVALNTDSSVSRLKGPNRPIQDQSARVDVMSAVTYVDAIVLFDDDTPIALIRSLMPDVLVKGADYSEDQIVGADVVKAAGGVVFRAPLIAGQSTSRIIEKSRK